jgi:flavin reductase (DIM6/NTAB) family NADH-FMN oxidoreductase RutF
MINSHLVKVPAQKAYRLFNVGGTTLVSASHNGVSDVMPATWACPLDIVPFKATVVIDKSHFTRPLIEKSGYFALMLPTMQTIETVMKLGSISKNDMEDKLEKSGAQFFTFDEFDMPMVKGCAAYAIFKLISEEHNQKTYDLFIGEAVAVYADDRVFNNGHFIFENADPKWSTLHYVAGGRFYSIHDATDVAGYEED